MILGYGQRELSSGYLWSIDQTNSLQIGNTNLCYVRAECMPTIVRLDKNNFPFYTCQADSELEKLPEGECTFLRDLEKYLT